MRNLKKVLALVIAFSMMLSVVAFASYNDVDADADYAGAVELLSALEIIKGDDQGNFNPDNTITRAEMAAIICRALGLEEAATGAMGATAFDDVAADHWASGYVNLATQNGIINGYGDGKFGPEDTVTYEQAVKMIVCALGFEPMATVKGGWSTGYLVVANTYKITAGANATATRANIAILVANALSTPMMDQTTFGADAEFAILNGKNNNDYKTLLTGMDIYIATGVVGAKNEDKVEFTVTEPSEDGRFTTGTANFVIGDSNIMDYKNQSVDAYVYEYARGKFEVITAVPAALGETITILSDDIITAVDDDTEEIEYYVDGANSSKKAKIKVVAGIDVEHNGQSTLKNLSDILPALDIELQFVENTGDSTYDIVVATQYISDRVDSVDADRDKLGLKEYGTITFDFEDESKEAIFVDDEGNAIELADFAADDIVAFVCDDVYKPRSYNTIKIIKLANASITGTVDATFTKDDLAYVEIDGKEYVDSTETLAIGDEGTFYVGMTGKIIDYDASLAGQSYAYILEAAEEKETFGANYVWKVKLLTKDGGVAIYDIAKNSKADVEAYLAPLVTSGNAADHNRTIAFSSDYVVNKLVKFKLNSAGEIKKLEAATASAREFAVDNGDEYKADAQTLAGKALADSVAIFMIDGRDAEDAYVTDLSALVDEGKYTGFTFMDDRDEYSAVVISETDSKFSEDLGWAVVTKVATSKDAEGNDITKISYVQDETEGVAIFSDEDATNKGNATYGFDTLAVGDVFMFVADAEGNVSDYIVVAKITNSGAAFNVIVNDPTDLGRETELVYGYIANTKKASSTKGENLTIGTSVPYIYNAEEKAYAGAGDQYLVRGSSNKYTYNDAGRNVVIEAGDFMAEDVAYAEIIDTNDADTVAFDAAIVSYVLVRLVDGEVVDIYSLNKAATIAAE